MKSGLKAIVAAALSLAMVFSEAYKNLGYTQAARSKRRHRNSTRMSSSMGKRLNASRIAHHPGSIERLGFRRSDDRHPKHSLHIARYHATGECDCVGIIHRRTVPFRIEGQS